MNNKLINKENWFPDIAFHWKNYRETLNGLGPLESFLDNEISKMFPELTKTFGISYNRQSYPKVDIIDTVDQYKIIAEIPGLSKDEISVDIEDDSLVISGTREKDTTTEDTTEPKNYIIRELKHTSFKRKFILGKDVDKKSIIGNFDNGLLTIIIKKLNPDEPKKPKCIKVKIE